MLLLEILPNTVSKEVDHILKSKILRIVVRNLGDANRPSLRKCSHSCLLQYVKNYHNFDSLLYHYTREGVNNGTSWQLQQKCINSFQSILIMEVRHLNWASYELKRWFELLLDKLRDENMFVSKAASQCLSSFCKMQSVKMLIDNLSLDSLAQLKTFVKAEPEPHDLSEEYLDEVIRNKLEQLKKKDKTPLPTKVQASVQEVEPQEKQAKPSKQERYREVQQPVEKEPERAPSPPIASTGTRSQSTNPVLQDLKRIDKIRRTLKTQRKQEPQPFPEPIPDNMNNIFNKKLMDNLRNQNNWKQRIEAAEEILCKIEINKHKPEIEGVMRSMLPFIVRLLSDQNFKLVLVGLKILENILESSYFRHEQSDTLIPALLDKLADAKISVRQNVFKLIKILLRSTDRNVWIESAIAMLLKGSNQFQKDQLFNLLQYIYEDYGSGLACSWEHVLRSVAPFMEDPKTKIKIKALDTLVLVAVKNNKVDEATDILQSLLSPVFFEMFAEKISKSVRNADRRSKINKIHAAVSDTFSVATPTIELERTIRLESRDDSARQNDTADELHNAKGRFDVTRNNLGGRQYETLDMKELKLNSSIQVARKGLLNVHRKNRKLSMREKDNKTISVTVTKKDQPKPSDDLDRILPSLTKKQIPQAIPDLPIRLQSLKPVSVTASKSSRSTYEPVRPKPDLEHKGSEYLDRSELKNLQDPERELKILPSGFKDPDWHNQFDAINTMRRIIENHEEVVAGAGSSSIHMLILELLRMVESLRSSVSKNAMIALGEMIVKLRRSLDSQIEAIMEKLLKKAADTNIFISEEVKKCLSLMAVNLSEGKLLQVMSLYKDSKTFSVKDSLLSMLASMIESERILKKEHARIGELLVFFLNEGHLDLRTKARSTILQLCRSLPDWQKQLKIGLSTEAYKAVLEIYNKNEASMSSSHMTLPTDDSKLRTIEQPRSYSVRKEASEFATIEGSARKKPAKITAFPTEFNSMDALYEECKNGEWKKRIQSIREVADLALRFPSEFCQFRNSSKFMDLLAQQIIQPNTKVSLHAMQLTLQLIDSLKPLFQNNLSIFTNSVFSVLSSNKQQLREEAERVCSCLFGAIDIGLLLQHLCHGCLYSLPKSKANLLNKLARFIEPVYQSRQPLIGRHIIPLLNKLVDENKSEYASLLQDICRRLLLLMGEEFYLVLAKPNQVRDMMT